MTVPKLPPFDAKAANNAWRTMRKPDGSEYAVFGSGDFVTFTQGLRGQRDVVAAHDVQLGDHKSDIDEHSARLADLELRTAALEARPTAGFPFA